MTKNRIRTPVYLDPGMHPGLEVKGLTNICSSFETASAFKADAVSNDEQKINNH